MSGRAGRMNARARVPFVQGGYLSNTSNVNEGYDSYYESGDCMITGVEANQCNSGVKENVAVHEAVPENVFDAREKESTGAGTDTRHVTLGQNSMSVSVVNKEGKGEDEVSAIQSQIENKTGMADGREESSSVSLGPKQNETQASNGAGSCSAALSTNNVPCMQAESEAGESPAAIILQQAQAQADLAIANQEKRNSTSDSGPNRPTESDSAELIVSAQDNNKARNVSDSGSNVTEAGREEGRKEIDEEEQFSQLLPSQPSLCQVVGGEEEGGRAKQRESLRGGVRLSMGGRGEGRRPVASKIASLKTAEGKGDRGGRGQMKEVMKTRSQTGRK